MRSVPVAGVQALLRARVTPMALAIALVVFAGSPAAAAGGDCGSDLPGQGRQLLQGAGYSAVVLPSRWPIPVGQHFSLQVQLCTAAGAGLPQSLRVDADMPAHRHGMNYRTTVKDMGSGRYLAEGLLFHMPGRWRLRLDLGQGAEVVRLEQALEVR
ncbi:MAG: hypothetical protein KAX42_12515 [Sphaerotilus sp.]|nr:hypothetical protein [Sphaerotilus sp.]